MCAGLIARPTPSAFARAARPSSRLLLARSPARSLGIRNMTKACDFKKVFQVNDKILVGFSGLATDLQTLEQRLRMRCNMYKLREDREISIDAFGNLVASMQYEKR